MKDELVLVTGGTGFIGAHCVLRLLEEGYRVRATLRDASRQPEVMAMLETGGSRGKDLSFAAADLTSDAGWREAAEGCSYVLHVASPFPKGTPKDENELIVPAREGALRVLRAARDAGAKRVVMTSSFAAVGYGTKVPGKTYTEEDWSDPSSPDIGAYAKSKTLAERAAWDFVAEDKSAPELAVVNPVAVFGPVLGPDYSTSIEIVRRMMDGELPGIPRMSFGVVDVRDVADLHLRAMVHPAAAGERFLAVAGDFLSLGEMAAILRRRLGEEASRVPVKKVPDWLIRLAALFDPAVRQVLPQLGMEKAASHEKAGKLLGWSPRSNEEAVVATAESLVRLRLLKKA